jgi:hypothetical protein
MRPQRHIHLYMDPWAKRLDHTQSIGTRCHAYTISDYLCKRASSIQQTTSSVQTEILSIKTGFQVPRSSSRCHRSRNGHTPYRQPWTATSPPRLLPWSSDRAARWWLGIQARVAEVGIATTIDRIASSFDPVLTEDQKNEAQGRHPCCHDCSRHRRCRYILNLRSQTMQKVRTVSPLST